MMVVGEDGGDGDVVVVVAEEAEEADVAEEEEAIGRGIMTVMTKGKEKESNWQVKKAWMLTRVRRGDGLSSQMADLTLGYVGLLLLQLFKARRKPSWTMDLLLPRSRTNKELYYQMIILYM
jgi:hypothetical protein